MTRPPGAGPTPLSFGAWLESRRNRRETWFATPVGITEVGVAACSSISLRGMRSCDMGDHATSLQPTVVVRANAYTYLHVSRLPLRAGVGSAPTTRPKRRRDRFVLVAGAFTAFARRLFHANATKLGFGRRSPSRKASRFRHAIRSKKTGGPLGPPPRSVESSPRMLNARPGERRPRARFDRPAASPCASCTRDRGRHT